MTKTGTERSDFSGAAGNALKFTAELIERFGARLAGSRSSLETALVLQENFKRICGNAELDEFRTVTAAFLGFIRVIIPLYIVALALMYLRMIVPSLAGFWFIILGSFLEFGLYREFFDFLYPKRTCRNVSAVLEPRAEVKRQLILSGHHDSAHELTFLRHHQKLLVPRIVLAELFYLAAGASSIALLIFRGREGELPSFYPYVLGVLTVGLFFVIPLFFMVGKKGTPGAGDNLIASAMLLELAGMFADPEAAGKSVLEHTRLVFVSFDAEESGLRGSRRWAGKRRKEFRKLPSWNLNFDSIYKLENLQFMVTDLNGIVRLDRELAQKCRDYARRRGYPAELYSIIYGAGATDAAELAVRNVRATTAIALSTKPTREGITYHTLNDTVEHIEPEAVKACLAVGHDFILSGDLD